MKKQMHYSLLLVMVVMSFLLLNGCGSGGDSDNNVVMTEEEDIARDYGWQDGEYQAKENGVINPDNIINEMWRMYVVDHYITTGNLINVEVAYREGFYDGFEFGRLE